MKSQLQSRCIPPGDLGGKNGGRETDIFVRDFLEPNNGISFVNLLAKIQRSREFMTEDR